MHFYIISSVFICVAILSASNIDKNFIHKAGHFVYISNIIIICHAAKD